MDEKSKTVPRSKREKSPSPSASSLVSIRSLKKIPLVSRRRKKKKSANLLQVPVNDLPGQYVERETDVSEVEVTSAEESTSSPLNRSSSSPSMSRREVNFAMDPPPPPPPLGKSPKPKKRFKNLIKGGKNLFKNKNESTPILVDTVTEVRRGMVRSREETGTVETANGVVIPEVIAEATDVELESESLKDSSKAVSDDEETADYDWSISSTCARVKKMSIAEIRESVYVEVPEDDDDDDDDDVLDQTDVRSLPSRTATPDVTEDEMSAKKFSFISASVPSTPDPLSDPNDPSALTFNRKSPSTLKKEILQITKHRKASEQYGNGALVKNRKASLQARNPTDKNELLFKILVIGEISTGKTSIIKRYVHQFFSQHYRATIGVDFALKVLSWDNNTTIRLQLWDIAGQERFGSMTRVYYKEAVGAFIVFDVTRAGTFDAVVKWKQDLDSKIQLPDGGPIPCVLLANKCDQPKEVIVNNQNKMDEFCKEHRFIAWFETSAKDNINIDEAAHCLVTKIVQNDQERQDEKEYTNGFRMAENRSISLDNLDAAAEKNKNCAC